LPASVRGFVTAVVDFGRAWLGRFVGVQGVDRAMALAALSFSALIPLLIVYSASVPRPDGEDFASELIDRFDLEGDAAASVREAFTATSSVTDSTSVFSLLLLIASALSFTRGLQRLYESVYGLPALGMRGTPAGLTWLVAVVAFLTVRPLLSGLFDGEPLLELCVSLALAAALWTWTPYLLLARRLPSRVLLPGAILAAIGNTGLALTSVIWLPRTITDSAAQYGAIGVAFALLGWLVAACFVLVISAAGGAVASERLSPSLERQRV
jgi:membrane protein